MSQAQCMKRLMIELKEIKKETNHLFSISPTDDFLTWEFIVIGPPDTLYEGGLFSGKMEFTKEYPNKAPVVYFNNIIHPNIYSDGKVCISILHEGTDTFGYEKDIERWLPTHGISTVMISIISMLSAPNFESPANIDASKLWKDHPEKYKREIYKMVALSQA
jgi:ubiquitin-conjugating enzyme E2 G1